MLLLVRLNLGFISEGNLLLCSSYLPLGVPNDLYINREPSTLFCAPCIKPSAVVDGINGSFSSSAAGSSGAIPANYGSSGSSERWGRISGERGVEWCEELVLGRAPFIGSTVRPSGMGGRRWRHGYGELAAWLGMAIDGRSPGGALVLQ